MDAAAFQFSHSPFAGPAVVWASITHPKLDVTEVPPPKATPGAPRTLLTVPLRCLQPVLTP